MGCSVGLDSLSGLLRPAPAPHMKAFRTAHKGRSRDSIVALGEGRSANRTKWATAELAGEGAAAAAVVERPASAQTEQLEASELVRHLPNI